MLTANRPVLSGVKTARRVEPVENARSLTVHPSTVSASRTESAPDHRSSSWLTSWYRPRPPGSSCSLGSGSAGHGERL